MDPEERRGGQDLLKRFASRQDLYADVDRIIIGLREPADPTLSGGLEGLTEESPHIDPADDETPTVIEDAAPSAPETLPAYEDEELGADADSDTTDAGGRPTDDGESIDKPPRNPPVPSAGPWWRRNKIAMAVAGLVIAVVVVVAVSISLTGSNGHSSGAASSPAPAKPAQTTVPLYGLTSVQAVTVDSAGEVYVTDQPDWTGMERPQARLLKVHVNPFSIVELPFTGSYQPTGVAVDSSGNVYVSNGTSKVLKLSAGSTGATELPMPGDLNAMGVAVDSVGNVYVTDTDFGARNRVLKLAPGSTAATELPFTGLTYPEGIAVDPAGDIYVTIMDEKFMSDAPARVLKLAAGSTASTALPFTGLFDSRVAVDAKENVYVTSTGGLNRRAEVLKLAAGSSAPTELPVTDLAPTGIAVDSAGDVYVVNKYAGVCSVVRLTGS